MRLLPTSYFIFGSVTVFKFESSIFCDTGFQLEMHVRLTYRAFFFSKIYLFVYFWLSWVFVAAHGLSLVVVSRGYPLLRCAGFSLRWLFLLWSMDSRHVGFSSCGAWASLLCSMWGLPGPGLEPMSPALAGGFLTTAPPRKSYLQSFIKIQPSRTYARFTDSLHIPGIFLQYAWYILYVMSQDYYAISQGFSSIKLC